MGTDIFMYLVKDNKIVKDDIYKGRDSEWFQNLQGDGWDDIYDELTRHYGVSPQAPLSLAKKANEAYHFDRIYMSVKDFKDWFTQYKPHLKAGWVTTYDKWNYETRGAIPDEKRFLDKEDNINDYHFIEYTDEFDKNLWLYNYLVDNNIEDDVDITYWFG